MSIKVFTLSDFKKSDWSGGTTTQLFISPEDSSLKEKDFDLRISTATIDVKESDFTPMPGFERKLMVLKGKLNIEHIGHYSVDLDTFEQDHFSGDWQSKGKGKVIDFNVIYKSHLNPTLSHINVSKKESVIIENLSDTLIYLFRGEGEIGKTKIKKGELVLVEHKLFLSYTAIEESDLVVINMKNRI